MPARVVPIGDVQWDPNVTRAVLVASDEGGVELSFAPYLDDPDRRRIRLVWRDAVASTYFAINDEGRSIHPLYGAGLADLIWLGSSRARTGRPTSDATTDGRGATSSCP